MEDGDVRVSPEVGPCRPSMETLLDRSGPESTPEHSRPSGAGTTHPGGCQVSIIQSAPSRHGGWAHACFIIFISILISTLIGQQPHGAGFLAKRAAVWPELAARLIRLSGDVHLNPGPTLRIAQCNINGWRKHQPALERFLQEHDVDVAVLQETKLTANVPTPKMPGFTIIREDRVIHRVGNRPDRAPGPPQGGLTTLIRQGIVHQQALLRPNPQGAAVERLAVTLHLSPEERVTVVNLYRPPARAAADDQRDADPHLATWPSTPDTIICADINAHGSWDPGHDTDDIGTAVDDWMTVNNMVTFNSGEATRISAAGAGTAPDITLGHGRWATKFTWRTERSIGSDHLPILTDLEVGTPGRLPLPSPRSNYKKAVWPEYQRNVTRACTTGGQWDADSFPSLDQAAAAFVTLIMSATKGCIPRGALPRPKGWWTPECQQARQRHHEAEAHLRAHINDPDASAALLAAREAATNSYHAAKQQTWRNFAATLNPRTPASAVWRTIRTLDGRGRERLPDTPVSAHVQGVPQGRPALSDKAKADLAVNTFAAASRVSIPREDSKVSTEAIRSYLRSNPATNEGPEKDYTPAELDTTLRTSGGKAPGCDRVHPLLLRKLPPAGKTALLSLLNRSWHEGRLPATWRTAIIVPIRKKGKAPVDVKSYRPVSLLSTIGKVLESMLQRRLQEWAERNRLIPECQSGFRRDRSTTDALNQLVQRAFDRLQHQPMRRTVLVAVDFRAAFDTIWRRGLLQKLAAHHIPPRWLLWLRAYLADRRARVRWNEALSRNRVVKEGVPQGSPLSPLLFLLYMASLPSAIQQASPQVSPVQFADDLTLEAGDVDPHQAGAQVQSALHALEGWSQSHHMKIAPDKTEALLVTTHPRENNGKLQLGLTLLNTPIVFKPTIKVLGVTLDSTLTMTPHAKSAATTIRQRCGALAAVACKTWGADTTPLRDLYTGYVRPAGTYALGTWWPYLAPTIKARVEAANNIGARIITGVAGGALASATRQEAQVPGMETLGGEDAALQLLHYRRFPRQHPLRELAEPPPTRVRQKARGGGTRGHWREAALNTLEEAGLRDTFPQAILPPDACPPPWEEPEDMTVMFHATQGTTREDPPESRREAAETLLREVSTAHGEADIQVWSDGAADEGIINGGAGVVITWHDGREATTISRPAGRMCNSTSAEALALATGLREVRDTIAALPRRLNIWAAFDSFALFERLQSPRLLRTDHQTAEAVAHLHHLGTQHKVHVFWIPGHAGLPLNEAADEAAKLGSRQDQGQQSPTAAAARAHLKRRRPIAALALYEALTPADHLHRRVSGGRPLPDDDRRTRAEDVALHQLRLNRAPYLQKTKFKWGQVDNPTCPHCNDGEEDADHLLLRCPRWAAIRAHELGPNPDISILHEHAAPVLSFLKRAGLFNQGHH